MGSALFLGTPGQREQREDEDQQTSDTRFMEQHGQHLP